MTDNPPAVIAILRENDRVLVIRRDPKVISPGWWTLPGGRIETGRERGSSARAGDVGGARPRGDTAGEGLGVRYRPLSIRRSRAIASSSSACSPPSTEALMIGG